MVTRRCTQRQYLLVPRRRTNEMIRYCVAYAASRTGVDLHAVMFMSNHYHIIVTDPDGVLPVFVACLNKLIAKTVNASLGRWENLWASEPASYVRLLDDEAILDKIVYALCNPVQAGLVKHGDQWPGVRYARFGTYRVPRPEKFFRTQGSMPRSLELKLEPPPLRGLSRREVQKKIDDLVREREAREQATMRAKRRKFLGAAAVKRQSPFDSPNTREPRRKHSPRVASTNRWLREEMAARCAAFVRAYAEALSLWQAGKRDVLFPVGTYLMRIHHRVCCADC